jgi:hypothetical protein
VTTKCFVHGHNVVFVLGCKLGEQECRLVVVVCGGHSGAMLGDHVVDITLDHILSLAQQKVVDLRAFGAHTQHRLNLSGYERQQHGLHQYLFNTCSIHALLTDDWLRHSAFFRVRTEHIATHRVIMLENTKSNLETPRLVFLLHDLNNESKRTSVVPEVMTHSHSVSTTLPLLTPVRAHVRALE